MLSFFQTFLHNPVGLLFIIIGAGILIGQIPLGRIRLGGSGVLLVGIIFGHFHFELPSALQTIGVVFFVYAVGLKAGPSFIRSLRQGKAQFLLLSLIIVLTAGGCAFGLHKLFDFPLHLMLGVYAGAMTSTPALAAAMETTGSSAPSVGYGLAYPLGILGVILMVQIIPPLLRINLKDEEKKFQDEIDLPPIQRKTFRVSNPNATTVSIAELMEWIKENFSIVRIKRDGRVLMPLPDENLKLNDLVLAVGLPSGINSAKGLIGEEVEEQIPISEEAHSQWVPLTSKQYIGKQIGALELFPMFGVIISRIRRGSVEFMPTHNFTLEAGDEVRVSGRADDIKSFSQIATRDPSSAHESDILAFSIGLAFGVFLGLIKIPLTSSLNLQLGLAGGPLVAGLIFGYVGRFGRLSGNLPKAANLLVSELGLYLFLAVAGCSAGRDFAAIFQTHGWLLVGSGLAITFAPILTAIFIARSVFKMNMLLVLGMISGGMTSTPALGVISNSTKSDIPALAYTAIYPLAILFTTLMVQLMALGS